MSEVKRCTDEVCYGMQHFHPEALEAAVAEAIKMLDEADLPAYLHMARSVYGHPVHGLYPRDFDPKLTDEALFQLEEMNKKGRNQTMGTDDLGSGVDVPVVPPANHRPVKIEVVLNGYLVKVGCQNVVFESLDKMLKELGKYYRNPAAVEREYLKKGEAK